MHHLWDAFNDIAEGFGLTSDEMCEILRVCLKDELGYTEKKLDAISRSLFVALDDDKNELVDALEFLSAICVISGMSHAQKIQFIFGVFDFDESGLLTVDEMILALRSTISGLCKLSGIDLPSETEIERIAVGAFNNAKSIEGSTIEKHKFTQYCVNTPEIMSWIEFYADIMESSKPLDGANSKRCERLISSLGEPMLRTKKHQAVMDMEGGQEQLIAVERGVDGTIDARPSPPWLSSVAFLEPVDAPEAVLSTMPDECLELEWIYGFNAQRRQNVFYTKRSQLVYSAGAVGVIFDVLAAKQRFFNSHTDLIECLRVHHTAHDTYVATGQLGIKPKVIVWSCNTLEVMSTMRGLHTTGVMHLDFSLDGELLVSVGALTGSASDKHPTQLVAVYEWRKGRIKFTAQVDHACLILDARFLQGNDFATCGVNHVHFWWAQRDTYYRERGLLCRKTQPQPFLAIAAPGDKVVCGAASGHLLAWEGRTCSQTIKVHSGAITALYAVGEAQGATLAGLVSGSTDGKVQLWSESLELGATFDVAALGGLSQSIHGVCWDPTKNKICIATDACEIFEISASEGHNLHPKPMVVGHSERRLSGLACHPKTELEVCSVGDDKVVYIWNADDHSVVRSVVLDTMARCCGYSHDGTMLAIGLGGVDHKGKRQRKDGAYVILDSETLTIIHEARDSKMPITAVAFSPDGLTLAMGSEDRALYLYNVGDFAATTKCRGHKGRILQLDWSQDSKFLQSTDDIGELLFWEADSGEQRAPRLMRDTKWVTQSCIFGWPLKGAWGSEDGPDDSCFLAASCRLPAGDDDSGHLIASTDNYGRVKLWRFPVIAKNAFAQDYCAHAAPGGSVAFTRDGKRLFTTSRGDGCVFQWMLQVDTLPPDESALSTDTPSIDDQCDYAMGKTLDRDAALEAAARFDQTALFKMEERGNDEDYAPLRPWQRTIVAPSRPPVENLSMPSDRVDLEWVHGYRCHDSRGNVRYAIDSNDVIFPAAQIMVLMNHQDRTQRYFQEHAADIVGIAVHSTVNVVATGEAAKFPMILVWDSTTLKCLCQLRGYHRRAVPLLAFSPAGGGKYLVTMGCDELHTAVVFDWATGAVTCKTLTQREKPLALIFAREGSGFGGGMGFTCCGVNFLKFWNFSGRTLGYTHGRLGAKGRIQPFLCLGWQGSSLVMGNMDGSLYRFIGRQLDKAIQAHTGAVNCIYTTNEGLCTGGKDGLVKLWSMQLDMRLEIDMTLMGSLSPSARSVVWDNERGRILVGTLGAEIWEVDTAEGKNLHPEGPVLYGHFGGSFGGELWALSCHPTLPQFCTAGDDKMLRVWSLFEKRQLRCNQLEMMSRACAYSPDGKQIAVGFGAPVKQATKQFDGKFVIMNADDFAIIHEARDSQKWITEIKYAPSGELLAVGSFDNRIYVYVFDGGMIKLQNMITQHNSFIMHIDFSVTANIMYLQSNCGAYELCFFEADTGMFIPAASRLKDVRWTTLTCPLSWATQGIHAAQNDGSDVTAVDCALQSTKVTVACGDNFGRIRLYRYPVTSALAKCKEYRGHSTHITKVRWSAGDSHLLTISAHDRTIFQWEHIVDDVADEEQDAQVTGDVDNTGGGGTPEPLTDSPLEKPGIKDKEGTLAKTPDQLAADIDAAVVDEEFSDDEADPSEVTSKPWLLAAVPPSNAPKAVLEPPAVTIEMRWVHGCQTEMTRSSLVYNALGDVIYPISNLCVIYSKAAHKQQFYRGHSHAISACGVSACGRFVASGERARRSRIHVWDAEAGVTVVRLPPYHRGSTWCSAFNFDATKLVSVGADNDGSLAVWRSIKGEWYDGCLLAAVQGGDKAVRFACFANNVKDYDGYDLASGGDKHMYFWTQRGATLTATDPLWAAADNQQRILCGTAVLDRFITGTKGGHLYVWKERHCVKTIRAHEHGLESIHAAENAGFVTGAHDGFVKLWTTRCVHIRSYDLTEAPIAPLKPVIHSVHIGLADGEVAKVLVGTASSEIYEISKNSGSMTLLGEGHYTDELWVVATNPADPDVFATAGDDMTVRVWSVEHSRLVRKAQLDAPCRCIDWSPNGELILVGMGGNPSGTRNLKDGVFLVLDSNTLQVKHEGRDSRHWLRCCKFSPDGTAFAVGSMDQKVYLYDTESMHMRAKCLKHNSFITHLDWSEDSKYIQSDSHDYEHLYYNAIDGAHVRLPSQLKDVLFDDWSCIYGWPTQGAWSAFGGDKGRDPKCDITTVNCSNKKQLFASGDEAGAVRLFRYPCAQKSVSVYCSHHHVAHVARVAFTADDLNLITVGKQDRSIVVWKIEYIAKAVEDIPKEG